MKKHIIALIGLALSLTMAAHAADKSHMVVGTWYVKKGVWTFKANGQMVTFSELTNKESVGSWKLINDREIGLGGGEKQITFVCVPRNNGKEIELHQKDGGDHWVTLHRSRPDPTPWIIKSARPASPARQIAPKPRPAVTERVQPRGNYSFVGKWHNPRVTIEFRADGTYKMKGASSKLGTWKVVEVGAEFGIARRVIKIEEFHEPVPSYNDWRIDDGDLILNEVTHDTKRWTVSRPSILEPVR